MGFYQGVTIVKSCCPGLGRALDKFCKRGIERLRSNYLCSREYSVVFSSGLLSSKDVWYVNAFLNWVDANALLVFKSSDVFYALYRDICVNVVR